ncbi:hypothetical protein ABVK25_009093 [Lepraria finkii]|uniref:Uncharacterized protein n=1 Tax=Lepraria finkii TaxID=1340010 RepID=A0ABR4AY51_9LECA
MPRNSDAKLSILQDGRISEASWESQSQGSCPDEAINLWSDILEDTERVDSGPPAPSDSPIGPTPIYPPVVIEYISLIQIAKDYENKISVLNLLKFGCNIGEEVITRFPDVPLDSDLYVLRYERDALQNRLRALRDELQSPRRRCISEGHALWDIDQRFGLHQINDTLTRNEDQDPNSNLVQATRQTPSEVLEYENHRIDSKLLGKWSSNRDRVNRWLMYCLRTDRTQAQLHKSMLAEVPPDDTMWPDKS